MRRAELIALSGCGEPPDALPEELPVYLSDPARVGENAAPTLVELLGTTRSAYGHALLDAARTLTRAQAGCIGRFLATGVGQDWLAARRAAFPAAQQRFEAFVAAARSRGFLRIAWEDVGIPDGFRD